MKVYGPKLPISEEIHSTKYRGDGESFYEACCRVAGVLVDNDRDRALLKYLLLEQKFMPGGRIQASVGAARKTTPYNCFVSPTIPDTSEGIMEVAAKAFQTMRLGGGIGYDFSSLRPRGARIASLNSYSSGPVSFMDIFDSVCGTISSAGHRRGAQMGVLRVDHPDIEEFVRAKQNPYKLTNFNLSVGVTDEFMQAVVSGGEFTLRFNGQPYTTVDARSLWDEIMRSTWDWAEPGILFIDRINEYNNLHYCEEIATCNPCFTGDTKVWTSEGEITFGELARAKKNPLVLTQTDKGKLVYRRMHKPRVTQRDAEIIRIDFDNGTHVDCTPNHKIYLKGRGPKEAKDLVFGDRVASVYRRKANQKGYMRLTNGRHKPLEHHVPFGKVHCSQDVHHINGDKSDNRRSNLVLMDAKKHKQLHMCGDNNPMCRFPEKNALLKLDHSGEGNGRYRHDLDTEKMQDMRDVGVSFAKIATELGCSKYTVMKRLGWERPINHKVIGVTIICEKEDVYCGTVEETGKFFVALGQGDGILVSNCGEQPLPPNGACLLGSFNLVKYMQIENDELTLDWDQFKDDIPVAVKAMDMVIDVATYPLPEHEEEAKAKRRMGLGITGLANTGEALGFPYGSPEFIKFTQKVMRTLRNEAYWTSVELAKTKGAFPLYTDAYLDSKFIKTLPQDLQKEIKEHGIRNSHLISIAPTGTISLAADNVSSGIEPVFQTEYTRTITTPDGPRFEVIKDYGHRVFGVAPRCVEDLSVQEHLDVLVAVQKYVDSAVSKTCNVSGDVRWEEFKDVYMQAWKGGCKGVTTFRADGERFGILNTNGSVKEGAACTLDEYGNKTCE